MRTYTNFEHTEDYTFTNDYYRLVIQVPKNGGDLTTILYDLRLSVEPVSVSISYEHVATLVAFANDCMAIGYFLALIDNANAA